MSNYLEVGASKQRGLNWMLIGFNVHDMTNLPIPMVSDNEFDGVYSEHFIEHLYKYQGINFLKECMRILKPGGTIRICWPAYEYVERLVGPEDLTKDEFVDEYYNLYIKPKQHDEFKEHMHRSPQEQVALNIIHQAGQHLHVWAKTELMQELSDLGYVNVVDCEYGKSSIIDFNNIETPGRLRELHSSQIEATKPRN